MTAAAGVGEIPSAGADTPATAVLAGATGLLGTISSVTAAAADALNSFARGNLNAVGTFGLSTLTNIAATAAASKIPGFSGWAKSIGDATQQAFDLSTKAKEACHN